MSFIFIIYSPQTKNKGARDYIYTNRRDRKNQIRFKLCEKGFKKKKPRIMKRHKIGKSRTTSNFCQFEL